MATISNLTVTPSTINTGATAHVRATITPDTAKTATVVVTVDGQSGTGQIGIGAEPITTSLNSADVSIKGCVVATVAGGGTLSAPTLTPNAGGTYTFDVTFTAV